MSVSLSIGTDSEVLQNTVVIILGAGVGEYTVSLSDPVETTKHEQRFAEQSFLMWYYSGR